MGYRYHRPVPGALRFTLPSSLSEVSVGVEGKHYISRQLPRSPLRVSLSSTLFAVRNHSTNTILQYYDQSTAKSQYIAHIRLPGMYVPESPNCPVIAALQIVGSLWYIVYHPRYQGLRLRCQSSFIVSSPLVEVSTTSSRPNTGSP